MDIIVELQSGDVMTTFVMFVHGRIANIGGLINCENRLVVVSGTAAFLKMVAFS